MDGLHADNSRREAPPVRHRRGLLLSAQGNVPHGDALHQGKMVICGPPDRLRSGHGGVGRRKLLFARCEIDQLSSGRLWQQLVPPRCNSPTPPARASCSTPPHRPAAARSARARFCRRKPSIRGRLPYLLDRDRSLRGGKTRRRKVRSPPRCAKLGPVQRALSAARLFRIKAAGTSGGEPQMRKLAMGLLAILLSQASSGAVAQEKLTVWWVKGFYKSEDDALFDAIRKFEQKSGVTVDLSQYAVQDMIPKTVAALDAGTPPDVAYADVYDFQVTGKWASEGKLEDISDIIAPIKGRFAPNTVETTYLQNDKAKKRAYYAFPIKQQTMHIQYWADMLDAAGLKEADIPTTWKEYWAFWCDRAQPAYRKKTGTRIFGIGQPRGVDSSDSFYSFLTFRDAYNVKLVDDDGKLLVDDPKVRQGLIGALTDYTAPYTKGCTPPSSTSWKDPDNNVAFHNKTTLMTHNATISIAAKWLDDANNEAPPLVAVGAYAVLLAWNEYLYAFLLLSKDTDITLPVALGNFLAADDSPWELLMTTGLIYALPPAAIYYAFRRYMVAGLTAGAVKG